MELERWRGWSTYSLIVKGFVINKIRTTLNGRILNKKVT
jgi:hypothetical protein